MRLATRLALVAWIALAGCAGGGQQPPSRTETVELRLVDEGAGSGKLQIDRSHHDTAVVFRGDRVEFTCACPEGTEFTIEPPHLMLDFGELEGELGYRNASVSEALQKMAEVSDQGRKVHPLFGDWTPGPPGEEWFDAGKTIRSPAVVPGAVAHGVWKYTWKVRRKGDPESEDVWDPHIYGHTWADF